MFESEPQLGLILIDCFGLVVSFLLLMKSLNFVLEIVWLNFADKNIEEIFELFENEGITTEDRDKCVISNYNWVISRRPWEFGAIKNVWLFFFYKFEMLVRPIFRYSYLHFMQLFPFIFSHSIFILCLGSVAQLLGIWSCIIYVSLQSPLYGYSLKECEDLILKKAPTIKLQKQTIAPVNRRKFIWTYFSLPIAIVISYACVYYTIDYFYSKDNSIPSIRASVELKIKDGFSIKSVQLENFPLHPFKGLDGEPSLMNCLYFSAVTVATVGYGDICPGEFKLVKILVVSEIFCAFIVVIGFMAIISLRGERRFR